MSSHVCHSIASWRWIIRLGHLLEQRTSPPEVRQRLASGRRVREGRGEGTVMDFLGMGAAERCEEMLAPGVSEVGKPR